MVRVAVSENQVLELIRRTTKPADCPEDGRFLIWVTGVVRVNPSSPSITQAFAIPIGTTSTPSITRLTIE
jgi:hypothetical protein